MPEMKTLNGYEVVDAKAREDIEGLQEAIATIPETDLTNYYTKDEINEHLENINECDTYFFNPYEINWGGLGYKVAPAGLAEFARRFLVGEGVALYIAWQLPDSEEIRWCPATWTRTENDTLIIQRDITSYDFGRNTTKETYGVFYDAEDDCWKAFLQNSFIRFLPDKTYVDNAIAEAINALRAELGGN
jgi:hypothetical protein